MEESDRPSRSDRIALRWSGRLQPDEARTIVVLANILRSILAACLLVLVTGIALALLGSPEALSGILAGAIIAFSVVGAWQWHRVNRRLQRQVGARTGISDESSRLIDFRGFERFDSSLDAARSKDRARGTHA